MIRPRFRHTGRPCCLILLCLLLLPWLGACAPQYGVSVDSLRGPQADSAGTVYVPRPGVEGMAEDDLRFRDVAAQLEPCFTARGYTLKLDGQPQDKSDNLVFISFGISEPDVRIYTTVSYVPYTGAGGIFAIPAGCARKRRGPRSFSMPGCCWKAAPGHRTAAAARTSGGQRSAVRDGMMTSAPCCRPCCPFCSSTWARIPAGDAISS